MDIEASTYFNRQIRHYTRGRITSSELVDTLFDHMAGMPDEAFTLEGATELWASIPNAVRDPFAREVCVAIQPDFHRRPFACSGTRTAEQVRLAADEQTSRGKRWANAIHLLIGAEHGDA